MAESLEKSLNRNSVRFKIGLLMMLAVLLLSATCYLSYRTLSSVISSMRIDVNPELRLLSLREIAMDLQKAENCVRIYTVSKDPRDLKPYYPLISTVDDKATELRTECGNDTVLLQQTDTLSKLIEENIVIWNQLLSLNRDDKIAAYLKELSVKLDSASLINQKKDKGILKRVFSRSPKSPLNEQEEAVNLDKVVQQNMTTKEELMSRESQLATTSSEIKEKFYDIITKMETEVSDIIKARALAADQLAGKTYKWLIMISITGGLLSILVLFVIFRYIRNAYSYQIALENSKEEAEKLSRTKELFMANMSHEIRTPVTAISGFTGQLLHESFDENTSQSLRIIKSSSDHLLKIIDDILDFSKLQNDKLKLEKVHFSISRLVEDVYLMFENQALKNNTTLTCSLDPETPPVLLGDPYRLKQIMINLVSNSVKFTRNGNVSFSVKGIPKKDGGIELIMEFTDNGIGIDESKLNLVFEDFTQAEMSTTRKYGGSGLGLSIVKKLVDLHKGTIDLKSRKNLGTKITVTMPYLTGDEKQVRPEAGPPVSIPESIAGMKALIVDDEEYNRMLLKKMLERWNINCQEAVNGMEALELLKEDRFDILFMDMRMPGIDGLKTTRFIRDEMKIPETQMPVILISAATPPDDKEKYRKAGMSAFLNKPFTEESVMTAIVEVTHSASLTPSPQTEVRVSDQPDSNGKINLDNLIHISGGDQQFVKQMLASFISTTDKGLKEMQDAVTSHQWDSVADLAHKILPPCRHIGAMGLYSILNRIEKSIRDNNDTGSVEALTDKSLNEFRVVSNLLNEQISKLN
ncbi:MAG: ATP-binding protein [Bacteroidota bacterium]|nr:ATP-binding protein [Bacteroidota bacterium]